MARFCYKFLDHDRKIDQVRNYILTVLFKWPRTGPFYLLTIKFAWVTSENILYLVIRF